MNKQAFLKENKGFTLLELLVVIAIIGLLSSIVVVGVNKARERGADAKAKGDIRNLSTALQLYFDASLKYPTVATTSPPCPSASFIGCPAALEPEYVSKLPTPPPVPGTPYSYSYTSTDTTFTLEAKRGTDVVVTCKETGCSQ